MIQDQTLLWVSTVSIGLLLGIALSWTGFTPSNAILKCAKGDKKLLWGMCLTVTTSMFAFQVISALNLVDTNVSILSRPTLHWSSMMGGSFLFGVGMGLARMDILTSLLLIGRGSFSAIVVFLVTVLTIIAAKQGILHGVVNMLHGKSIANLTKIGIESFTLPSVIAAALEVNPSQAAFYIGIFIGGISLVLIIWLSDIWRSPAIFFTAILAGCALPSLWSLGHVMPELPCLLEASTQVITNITNNSQSNWSPISLFIITMIIGGFITSKINPLNEVNTSVSPWRVLTGSVIMGLGSTMANGDLVSHVAVGLPTLSIHSFTTLPIIFISAIGTLRMLDH